MKNKRKVIEIIEIVLMAVLAVSTVLTVKDNQYKEYELALLQSKVDEDFIYILNKVVIGWNEDNMTDEEVYAAYRQDATMCDAANAIIASTSYDEYDDLGLGLSYMSKYLNDLIVNKEKLNQDVEDNLSDAYFEMLNILGNESNAKKDKEKAVSDFCNLTHSLVFAEE